MVVLSVLGMQGVYYWRPTTVVSGVGKFDIHVSVGKLSGKQSGVDEHTPVLPVKWQTTERAGTKK